MDSVNRAVDRERSEEIRSIESSVCVEIPEYEMSRTVGFVDDHNLALEIYSKSITGRFLQQEIVGESNKLQSRIDEPQETR